MSKDNMPFDDTSQMSNSFMAKNKNLIRMQTTLVDIQKPSRQAFSLQKGKKFYHYLIEEKLGSGGMGEVFRAKDLTNNRVVAIKTLKTEIETARERFRREYLFLSSIDHPNLVKAYDLKEHQQELFIVMELVEGKSLKEIIDEEIHFSFTDKVAVACQITQGIEALNLAGIIHRDIKPANIMINKSKGIVKVLDLGLGKDIRSEVKLTNKQILGTFFYMAPEQIDSEVTKTTDIFSLGTVLWQWFSGSKVSPFFTDSQYRTFLQIATYDPPHLSEILIKQGVELAISQKLGNIIFAAMRKEADKRTTSASIIVNDLLSLHSNLPSQWQKPDISKNFRDFLANASHIYGDKDLTLHSSQAITNGTRVKRTRKTTKPKSTKLLLVLGIVSVILVVSFLAIINNTNKSTYTSNTNINSFVGQYPTIHPKSIKYNQEGLLLLKEKKFDLAEEAYNKAIEIDNKNIEAYMNRGELFLMQKKHDLAEQDYNRVLQIDPFHYEAFNKRGFIYFLRNKYDLAEKNYNRAIELNPTSALARNNRGYLYFMQDNYKLAEQDYNIGIEADPSYEKLYYNRSSLYYRMGIYDLAKKDLNKVLELNPKNISALKNRAHYYLLEDNYKQAKQDFDTIITIDPDDVEAYLDRGDTLWHEKEYFKALADWEKALFLGSKHPELKIRIQKGEEFIRNLNEK